MSTEENSPIYRSLVMPPRRATREPGQVRDVAVSPRPPAAPLTAADATLLDAEARLKRDLAESDVSALQAAKFRAEADGLEALATRLRDPAAFGIAELLVGRGGEVSPLPDRRMPLNIGEVAKTVQAQPGRLDAEASMDRLTLAREAGGLTLAVEAAESMGAEGAQEQALVHAMTTAHRIAMRLMAAADRDLTTYERERLIGDPGGALTNATRSATAAARLMDSVSRVALTLDRLRNGGRQHVTVQHVVVADGGQAVVTGNVDSAGGPAFPRQRRGGGGVS